MKRAWRNSIEFDYLTYYTKTNGEQYYMNDNAQKMFTIDNMIVTAGGVYPICHIILNKFNELEEKTVEKLHEITLETVHNVDSIATEIGLSKDVYEDNPYLIEFCILQYDEQLGHNAFYHIATSTKYNLFRLNVDDKIKGNDNFKTYGGIKIEVIIDYFEKNKDLVENDYLTALVNSYELAACEAVGGNLVIAMQNKNNINILTRKLKDKKSLKSVDLLCHNIVGNDLYIQGTTADGLIHTFEATENGVKIFNNYLTIKSQNGSNGVFLDPKQNRGIGVNNETYNPDETIRTAKTFEARLNVDEGIIFQTYSNGTANKTPFQVTPSGDASFSGKITGSEFIGGSLNINNRFIVDSTGNVTATSINITGGYFNFGNFTVDSGGNLTAYNATLNNATLTGKLLAPTIEGGTITGMTITGGTINGVQINGGNINVDSDISIGNKINFKNGNWIEAVSDRLIFGGSIHVPAYDIAAYSGTFGSGGVTINGSRALTEGSSISASNVTLASGTSVQSKFQELISDIGSIESRLNSLESRISALENA